MSQPRWSIIVSLSVHAAIVVAGLVALPNATKFEVENRDIIPVELITEVTETSQRQAVKKDAPPPKPEQKIAPPKVEEKPKPKPQPKAAKEPTPAPRQPAEPAPPDPKDMQKLVEDTTPKPAQKPPPPKPQAKPKPPQKKPAPKKELNVDELAALLNKIPDQEPRQDPNEVDGIPLQGLMDALNGADAGNSADLIDYLASATSQCWNPPTGVMEAQDLVISIKIDFAQDGSVQGTPEVLNSSASPLFGVAAAAAVRAVMRCAPYDKLPPARYNEWRTTTFNFNPAQMFAP